MKKVLLATLRHIIFTIYCVALLLATIVVYYLLRENDVGAIYRWLSVGLVLIVGCVLYVLVVKYAFPHPTFAEKSESARQR